MPQLGALLWWLCLWYLSSASAFRMMGAIWQVLEKISTIKSSSASGISHELQEERCQKSALDKLRSSTFWASNSVLSIHRDSHPVERRTSDFGGSERLATSEVLLWYFNTMRETQYSLALISNMASDLQIDPRTRASNESSWEASMEWCSK